MLFLPQTPQFLMIKKKEKLAEDVLRRLKLSSNIRQTLTDIRLSLTEEASGSFKALFGPENNMNGRMFIGMGLVMAQQLSGQPNILYYASDVFKVCTVL